MKQFDPKDLPDPASNFIYDVPGTNVSWGVNWNGEWEEYVTDQWGTLQSTGRTYNYATKVTTGGSTDSGGKDAQCRDWFHEWKEYNSGWDIYEYCVKCDKKRRHG